jgi:ankyrin repeat protein
MPDVASFHELVKRGDLAAVESALAEAPGLLDEQNQAGQSAFLLAKYYGQSRMADYLLGRGPKLDLFTAAAAGDAGRVFTFLGDDPAAIHSHSSDGWTPLHLAAFFGHSELAAGLIERGAAVDARSTNAMVNTPLHAAVAGGHVEVVRLLLERGAKVNASQHGGWTALHGAAQAGRRDIVEALIANGADVGARAENQQSPLDLALLQKRSDVAALLEELGAKLQ